VTRPRTWASEERFQQLLVDARAGDEASFAELWRMFNPVLVRFLTALAGTEDAGEVASAVWLEVVRSLDRFSGDEQGFRAWIFTIARHRLFDLRRAHRRRPPRAHDHDESDRRRGPAPDPASVVEARWSTGQAVELIGRLPPDQAEVLMLRVIADLDVATVAGMIGKRPGTVRVLAHRGLRRLAALLAEAEETVTDVTR
jgi:RNA polymerase sigma-70 factor (ECF subfamily)